MARGGPPERELQSLFAVPIVFGEKSLTPFEKMLLSDPIAEEKRALSVGSRNNRIGLFGETEGGPQVKSVTFQSELNSHQINDNKPVVSGFASGVKMENLPNGDIVVEKFEQPIGGGRQAKRRLISPFPKVPGKLHIEPAINLATIGKAEPQGPAPGDFLQQLLGGLGAQESDRQQRPRVIARPHAEANPLAGLLGGLGGKQQGGNPLGFINDLLGSIGDALAASKKNPTNEVDESANNPLSMILGGGQQAVPHKRISTHHRAVHVRKRTQADKLNSFLGNILGGPTVVKAEVAPCDSPSNNHILPPKPQINALGLHSGVGDLLNLLEGSEQERLTSPVNEQPVNPFAEILGDSNDNSATGSAFALPDLLGIATKGASQKRRKVRHHRKRITAIFNLPQQKKITHHIITVKKQQRSKPTGFPSHKPFHVPLMNNFYHIRGIRQSNRPLVFPPLGHRKSTLDKIRNNVFRFRVPRKRLASTANQLSNDVEHHTHIHVRTHHRRSSRGATSRRHHRHHRHSSRRSAMRTRVNDFISDLLSGQSEKQSECNNDRFVV